MREILFRGKQTDNGTWTYGYLFCIWERTYLCWGTTNNVPDMEEVLPETVCQFTGLYDKNGRKIFEGDIVEHDHPYGGKSVHTVIWNKYGWNLSDFYATYFDDPGEAFSEGTEFMTVIGNIYDNPGLLEGRDEIL